MCSTRVLGSMSLFGLSVRMRILLRASDTSSLSVVQLQTLVMKFWGFWEASRDSCASSCLSESWDWLEDMVGMELLERSDGIVRVGWVEPFGGVRGFLKAAFTWLNLRWMVIFGVMMSFSSAVSWFGLGVLGDLFAIWSSVMFFVLFFLPWSFL